MKSHIGFALASILAIVFSSAPPAAADETPAPHTVTWWCVDLNRLWHVDVPVIVGVFVLTPPVPSPLPPCDTTSTFPITIPASSRWTGSGNAIWYTHHVYTPAMVEALTATGYNFVSNSPMQDLMRKITEVRYVVRAFPSNAFVTQFTFDPQQNFRLVRTREFFGDQPATPIVDPDLGIDISAEESGRLPLIRFGGVADPLDPGSYRVEVRLVLSELHNDGLGLEAGNFLAAGEVLIAAARLVVVP